MISRHLFYQIYLSFLEQNDCTPPKCGVRAPIPMSVALILAIFDFKNHRKSQLRDKK